MKKQIFAIFLVTVMILGTFAACGKKYLLYTDSDGVTHPLLTDEDGSTMLNEYGQIIVGVTDERGKLVTDKDGANETRAVVFPSSLSSGNVFETPDFKLTLPEDIWMTDGNTIYKKDSEIHISVNSNNHGVSLAETMEQNVETLEKMVAASDETNKFTYEQELFQMDAGPAAVRYICNLYENDVLKERRESIFFEIDDVLYNFICVVPADEIDTVNFIDIMNMIKFR